MIIGYDTDIYFFSIKSNVLHKDLLSFQDEHLDTSDYPTNFAEGYVRNHLHFKKNKKVIGKFKDELNGDLITELVF